MDEFLCFWEECNVKIDLLHITCKEMSEKRACSHLMQVKTHIRHLLLVLLRV